MRIPRSVQSDLADLVISQRALECGSLFCLVTCTYVNKAKLCFFLVCEYEMLLLQECALLIVDRSLGSGQEVWTMSGVWCQQQSVT